MRRVQLDWVVICGWFSFGKKADEPTVTMGALLGRKRRVEATLTSAPDASPKLPIKPWPPAAPKPTTAPPPVPPKAAPSDADDSISTTERLLARKRKRDQDKK